MFEAEFEQSVLLDVLQRVIPAVASSDIQPVLTNYQMVVGPKGCRVSASDGVASLTAFVPLLSFTGTPAIIALPASRVLSILRTSSEKVLLKVGSKDDNTSATIVSSATWTFPLMDPQGFPDFTSATNVPRAMIKTNQFLAALRRVYTAMSDDSLRPQLRVVDVKDGKARASDSVRLQQVPVEFPFDCMIPDRAVHYLLKAKPLVLEGAQTDRALIFRCDNVLFTMQKLVAKFPAVDEVLLKPTLANDQEVIVDTKVLIEAIRRVRLFADEQTFAVALSLNKGSVSVQARDKQGLYAVEHVNADWAHSPRHVSFNHIHLTEFLAASVEDRCALRLGKDLVTKPSPLLIEDPDGFTGVLSQIQDWVS